MALREPSAVRFGGITVNEDETFEDLEIETDATLTVVCTEASGQCIRTLNGHI